MPATYTVKPKQTRLCMGLVLALLILALLLMNAYSRRIITASMLASFLLSLTNILLSIPLLAGMEIKRTPRRDSKEGAKAGNP